MTKFACFGKKLHYVSATFDVLINNCFCVQLCYFFTLSFTGFLALRFSKPRTASTSVSGSAPLGDLDVFFTSASAATVSSMSVVEMEVFSNFQLLVMTVLMLGGGEVFVSFIGLQLARSKLRKSKTLVESRKPFAAKTCPALDENHTSVRSLEIQSTVLEHDLFKTETDPEWGSAVAGFPCEEDLKYRSMRWLASVVLGYLMAVHVLGSSLIAGYVRIVPSAREVLRSKGISIPTFSVFTVVSTFTNCGFIPTNENMVAFKNNSGLLLLLIPQILMGNTLYPTCLRLILGAVERVTRRKELGYILKHDGGELGYPHLMPGSQSWLLGGTVIGFIAVQLVLFCSMEWSSEVMAGMSPYRKLVAALFQTVNTRHAGESVVDISVISPAILVLFVVMMYLPPYTSFLPVKEVEEKKDKAEGGGSWRLKECLKLSQLSYLAIFIILICITEREKLKNDPLNFNVLNITVEVISAYGNVGFSTGYSCERQVNPDGSCKDTFYGFAGRWSNKGKFILIIVMFFGRLKKFNMRGGKAWKLS